MSKNKESYLHKMAKELLYSQIVETNHFDTKDKDGLRIDDIAAIAHRKHHQATTSKLDIQAELKAIPTFSPREEQMVRIRWDKLNVCMEYVINVDLYDYTICNCEYAEQDEICDCAYSKSNDGYHPCSACPHANFNDTIIHDIAVTTPNYYNHIVYAIEIVHKHYPKWEGSIFRPYPTYIIRAENVLRRVENTPVFVERVI